MVITVVAQHLWLAHPHWSDLWIPASIATFPSSELGRWVRQISNLPMSSVLNPWTPKGLRLLLDPVLRGILLLHHLLPMRRWVRLSEIMVKRGESAQQPHRHQALASLRRVRPLQLGSVKIRQKNRAFPDVWCWKPWLAFFRFPWHVHEWYKKWSPSSGSRGQQKQPCQTQDSFFPGKSIGKSDESHGCGGIPSHSETELVGAATTTAVDVSDQRSWYVRNHWGDHGENYGNV